MTTQQDLPDYENPPVIEVVCGVLFTPIDALLVPHFGQLWEKFRSDYPHCQEVPPLVPAIERLEEPSPPEASFTEIPPLPRIWFVHTNDTGVIQIQRDRFLHNWRKKRPEDEYPRYHNVIKMFYDRLSDFRSFLAEAKLGTIQPLQYEMTYINHIPQGEGWTTIGEIGRVFPDLSWRSGTQRFLPDLEGFNWRAGFLLPDRAGRLHATIRPVVRRTDLRRILALELTARGMGSDASPEGMRAWFDLARQWIVRGFTDLTSDDIQQKVWRRRR